MIIRKMLGLLPITILSVDMMSILALCVTAPCSQRGGQQHHSGMQLGMIICDNNNNNSKIPTTSLSSGEPY